MFFNSVTGKYFCFFLMHVISTSQGVRRDFVEGAYDRHLVLNEIVDFIEQVVVGYRKALARVLPPVRLFSSAHPCVHPGWRMHAAVFYRDEGFHWPSPTVVIFCVSVRRPRVFFEAFTPQPEV